MSKLSRDDKSKAAENDQPPADDGSSTPVEPESRPKEIGGRDGPDPTRFGDWEKNGRCIDF